MDWNSIIIAILGGGLVSSFIIVFANRKNRVASAYKDLSDTVTSLSADLKRERTDRKKEYGELDKKFDELKTQNELLKNLVDDMFEWFVYNDSALRDAGLVPPIDPKKKPNFRG